MYRCSCYCSFLGSLFKIFSDSYKQPALTFPIHPLWNEKSYLPEVFRLHVLLELNPELEPKSKKKSVLLIQCIYFSLSATFEEIRIFSIKQIQKSQESIKTLILYILVYFLETKKKWATRASKSSKTVTVILKICKVNQCYYSK